MDPFLLRMVPRGNAFANNRRRNASHQPASTNALSPVCSMPNGALTFRSLVCRT